MGMTIASVGSWPNSAPPQELPKDRGRAQIHAAELRSAAIEKFEASLPGNRESADSSPRELNIAAAELERVSLAFNRKLQFVVDHKSNEVIVKVIDTQTDKVIKVLPPEELQRLHSKLKETIGFLFDEWV
ncbi:MAG: flagellar protein FlaG [Treponema sp.]|jgi:flagellar protein FlaG|nr:flagellar protein FlaG [Treponema sp.]